MKPTAIVATIILASATGVCFTFRSKQDQGQRALGPAAVRSQEDVDRLEVYGSFAEAHGVLDGLLIDEREAQPTIQTSAVRLASNPTGKLSRVMAGLDDKGDLDAMSTGQSRGIRKHWGMDGSLIVHSVWADTFDSTARGFARDWLLEGDIPGVVFRLRDGKAEIGGRFRESGRMRMFRELPAKQFVAFQVDLQVVSSDSVRVGTFVSREQYRRGQRIVHAMVEVSRDNERGLQAQFVSRDKLDDKQVAEFDIPQGLLVPIRIESVSNGEGGALRILVDGVAVGRDFGFPGLEASTAHLRLGVFVEGEANSSVHLEIDDAEVLSRQD